AGEAAGAACGGGQGDRRAGAAGLPGSAPVHAQRVRAGHAHLARRRGPAGRQGLLPREDPRVHHARHGPRRDPQARRRRGGASARGDGRRHARDGLPGRRAAFLKFLRTDPRFYVKTPEELLMRASWIAKRFDGKAAQYFGYLPRARFAIKPVPDDLAPFYTAGRGGSGVYLLNTYDLPSRPLYNLTALTLHESAPGHAFQMPIAMEHKDQPAFRQLTYISAYGEGWALYCEQLGLEIA